MASPINEPVYIVSETLIFPPIRVLDHYCPVCTDPGVQASLQGIPTPPTELAALGMKGLAGWKAAAIASAGMQAGRSAALEAEAAVKTAETSTVYRVQGGGSKTLITLDAAGNPIIKKGTLNLSIGDESHAKYFQTLRPGSTVTSFDIPSWLDQFIQENAIPQYGYRSNPKNQGGLAPKEVDPTTPGRSYELPSPWEKWLQENAIPGSGKVR